MAQGNVCIRCGKPRIVSSSYEEKILTSMVIHTTSICPDPECQKMVDKTLLAEANMRVERNNEKEEREKHRKGINLHKKIK